MGPLFRLISADFKLDLGWTRKVAAKVAGAADIRP